MSRGAERFPWGATLAVIPAMALLIWLGMWQVQRLHWKEDLLRHVEAARRAPARPVQPALAQAAAGQNMSYVRAFAVCPDIERTPFLRVYAVSEGVAGYRIVTACRVNGGPYRSLLVDRGFVSLEDVGRIDLAAGRRLDKPILGVLRDEGGPGLMAPANQPGRNIWHRRDVPAMAAALHAEAPAPLFLMLESPAPTAFGPQPLPLPIDIPNNHLGYAITWFGLAASLAAVYAGLLFRRRRPAPCGRAGEQADSR